MPYVWGTASLNSLQVIKISNSSARPRAGAFFRLLTHPFGHLRFNRYFCFRYGHPQITHLRIASEDSGMYCALTASRGGEKNR